MVVEVDTAEEAVVGVVDEEVLVVGEGEAEVDKEEEVKVVGSKISQPSCAL